MLFESRGGSTVDLNQVFEWFLSSRTGRSGKVSYHTLARYKDRLKLFLSWYGEMPVNELTTRHVNDWLDELGSRNYRPATMNGYRQAIKAFCNFCVDSGQLEASPAQYVRVGKFTTKDGASVPATRHVKAMAEVAQKWQYSDKPERVRDSAIFMLSYDCGPRISEIRNLKARSMQDTLDEGPSSFGIYTVLSVGKTGECIVRFSESAAEAIRSWMQIRPDDVKNDYLFCTCRRTRRKHESELSHRKLSREAATLTYRRLSSAAGLKKPILSHALRHWVGDRVAREHGPKMAAMILNHRDAETAQTAMAFYHHPNEDQLHAAIATSHLPEDHTEIARLFGLK